MEKKNQHMHTATFVGLYIIRRSFLFLGDTLIDTSSQITVHAASINVTSSWELRSIYRERRLVVAWGVVTVVKNAAPSFLLYSHAVIW